MSWQLGSFAILSLALAGGFAWYERTRPDARIVALVGALAAFAALGRIAFAALPNVKPTSDIVLIAGYALGGAPGFVVGAIGGLTSNFFFGQGPWTPWQMAAWGATGAIGAGLAIVTGRRIGRWPLALVCAVAGFAFTAVQDIGDWVNYSDHSSAQLAVYVGKGIGFDFIYAGSSLLFALALGPSLMRSLHRFRQRLQVVWHPLDGPLVAAIVLSGVAAATCLGARAEPARAAATPASYLLAAQNGDGGFGSVPGASSSELYAGWAALGLAANGYDPQRVRRGGRTVIDYIAAGGRSFTDPGSVERTILVLRAAGLPVTSFAGQDLLAELEGEVRGDGSVSEQVNLTSFAVLALRAAGVGPRPRTLSWLARQQDSDGGFNFATAGAVSDVDDTGAALEALAGAAPQRVIARAVSFIRRQQNSDGGFPSQAGGYSNAQSTAFAIQGLLAAGVDPVTVRHRAATPVGYLSSLIAPDGHVRYSSSSDQTPVWVTGQAAMALAGKPLPLASVVPPATAPRASATRHHGAPATVHVPAHPRAKASRHAKARPLARARSGPGAVPTASLDGFFADAGFIATLALAVVGAD